MSGDASWRTVVNEVLSLNKERKTHSGAPHGVNMTRQDDNPQDEMIYPSAKASMPAKAKRIFKIAFSRKVAEIFLEKVKQSTPRKKHLLQDAVALVGSFLRVIFLILGPIFSAVSIWISVAGIAFTLFSGVEPLIQLAHWVRFLTITWRNFTHRLWDAIVPYMGFEIPFELKDFATFIFLLGMALCLAFFSRGRRLVIYDAIVGIRMAIFGISHAINTSRRDGSPQEEMTRLRLLFFEIDQFLAAQYKTFFLYSIPFVAAFNLTFRTSIIFIPMIILVPESAFTDYFGVEATRVEYLFLSAVLSHCAAIIVVFCGVAHIVLHFLRVIISFFFLCVQFIRRKPMLSTFSRIKASVRDSHPGLSYTSSDPVRRMWSEKFFLVRFSATMIRSNWIWLPISGNERAHRKFDPFLWLSERRFADPAFLDRIAKGLFLFFILYGLNWVSINGENIANMFSAPKLNP